MDAGEAQSLLLRHPVTQNVAQCTQKWCTSCCCIDVTSGIGCCCCCCYVKTDPDVDRWLHLELVQTVHNCSKCTNHTLLFIVAAAVCCPQIDHSLMMDGELWQLVCALPSSFRQYNKDVTYPNHVPTFRPAAAAAAACRLITPS